MFLVGQFLGCAKLRIDQMFLCIVDGWWFEHLSLHSLIKKLYNNLAEFSHHHLRYANVNVIFSFDTHQLCDSIDSL